MDAPHHRSTSDSEHRLQKTRRVAQAAQAAVNAAAENLMARKHEALGLSSEMFLEFVDPAMFHGEQPFLDEDYFNTIFTEWVLFEAPVFEGRTPLQEYLAHPPAHAAKQDVALIRKVIETQFFSRFEIRYKDTDTGICTLVDVCTDKRYDVFNEALCATERWRDGTIALRIARIEGIWVHVGHVQLYDRAAPIHTSVDGPGFFHPEDRVRKPQAEHAGFYLRLIRDIIGIDGRYRRTATFAPYGMDNR